MIPDIMSPGSMRSRKYRSPNAVRGGSLDQGSPTSNGNGINSDPVRRLIKKLRTEKRERQKIIRDRQLSIMRE